MILDALLERRAEVVNPIHPRDPALARMFGVRATAAGVSVTEETAWNYSAVYCAIRCIAETCASLPRFVYERLPNGGKERVPGHALYDPVHQQPNPEMSAMVYEETVLGHTLTWGNGFSEIELSGRGQAARFWPIEPWRVRIKRDGDQQLAYEVAPSQDDVRPNRRTETVTLPASRMLHVPALGWNGIRGFSPIYLARESLGVAVAAEQFGGKFFANAMRPSGVLEHPETLSKEAMDRLRAEWHEIYGGSSNTGRMAILEEGLKFKLLAIPPDDAQFLQTRKFQITEVARWYRLPPHKLGDLEKATMRNIEEQNIEFVVDSIRPWLVRLEQEYNRKLFDPRAGGRYFIEHLVDGLLRGKVKERTEAMSRQWERGALTTDEWREVENRNPLPDGAGREHWVPRAFMPMSQALNPPEEEAPNDDFLRALRHIVADTVGRFTFKEAQAARRAAKSPDGFVAWVEKFYDQLEADLRTALEPSLRALVVLDDTPDWRERADQRASDAAGRYCAESRNQLLDAAGRVTPAGLQTEIASVVGTWDRQRPGQVAADLIPIKEGPHAAEAA